ncbi:MAG: glycosyltransferase family 2 protein [Gammaproteobacteria bacterium]
MNQFESEIDLSLLVPVFNEEEAIPHFMDVVSRVMAELGMSWEVLFVNDGSNDNTLDVLRALQSRHSEIRVIDFSRNFGKEAALTAGLDFSRGRAVIPIDVDLQDPPEVIGEMVGKWREGYDMVFAVRSRRDSDSHMKSASARLFYRFYNWMSQVKIPPDAGDFRLLDRRVVDAIRSLPERNRFMKGLFAWPGFRQAVVSYERQPRSRGNTKFNYWKLWNFAIDGMTSFSTLPLRVWSYVGGLVALVSFLYAIFLIGRTLIYGTDVPGYASLMVVVLFLGGLQLLTLGIIGEYLGRTYEEVKGRPIYIVRETYGLDRDATL